jgi:predicted Zn-dependent protease
LFLAATLILALVSTQTGEPALGKKSAPALPPKAADDAGCHDCLSRAASLFASGDTIEAAALLQSWRGRCPNNAQLRILLSTILIRTRTHWQEAEDAAREATEIAPRSLPARLQYAVALMCNQKHVQAVHEFEQVVEIQPDSYEGWSALGQLYGEMHEDQKAHQAQEKAAVLEPGLQTSRLRQLRALLNSNRPDALSQELQHIISSSSTQPEVLTIIAEQALQVGDFEAALSAADKALSIFPNASAALKARCLAQLLTGDIDGAASASADLIKQDPASAQGYAVHSLSEAMQADPERSLSDLDRARQLEPRNAVILLAQADRFYRDGKYKEAGTCVDSALDAQAPTPSARVIRAKMLLKQRKLDDAIAEARESARSPGLRADAYAIEARARLLEGLKDESAKAGALAAKSAHSKADSAEALLAQAAIAIADNRANSATSLLHQLLERQPGNPDAIFMLSDLARVRGDAAEQKRLLERCVNVSSGDPEACASLAGICLKENDLDRAVELSRQALKARDDSPEALYCLAQALERKGERDESIKFYKLCLSSGIKGADRADATEALKRLGATTAQP